MNINEITLQDERFNLHNLKKVKDSIFDPVNKVETIQWLWIYSETSEFFYIELWQHLDSANLYQTIKFNDKLFKVIAIDTTSKIRYS